MLTVDVGNSRIKWALWQDDVISATASTDYSKDSPQAVFDSWLEMSPQQDVHVACVAGNEMEQALTQWLQQHWNTTPVFLRTSAQLAGVSNAYPDPTQYGVDRWAALLGAHALYQSPVCIIDAGTAVTIDLMDAQGRHYGGRIMPGLAMMRRSLQEQTEGIAETRGATPDFAVNTADAVSSGTLHMLRAALIDACSAARTLLGSDMKIIITGGLAEQMLTLPDMPAMVHEPNLVLTGLHVAALGNQGDS